MFIDKLFEKFGYSDSHRAENGIDVLKKTRSRRDRSHTYGYSNARDGWYEATQRIIEKYGDDRPLIIALTADAYRRDST